MKVETIDETELLGESRAPPWSLRVKCQHRVTCGGLLTYPPLADMAGKWAIARAFGYGCWEDVGEVERQGS